MKAQLSRVLSISLLTLMVLAPLCVLWKIWNYHMDYVSDRPSLISHAFTLRIAMLLLPAIAGFIGSIGLGFWSGWWLAHHQQTQQNHSLKQQVAILEKIWQQSIY
jgi:hypothetical protein